MPVGRISPALPKPQTTVPEDDTMNRMPTRPLLLALTAAALCLTAEAPQTLTGTVGDDMCNGDHKSMGGTDAVKCTDECRKTMHARYALWVGAPKGKTEVYVLSDQKSPAGLVGKKVTATGTVTTEGTDKILHVATLKPAN